MWGAIIGAGLSLASSIAGGIANRKAADAQKAELERQKQENQAWYTRKYYEDPTKRADTQRLLTQMHEQIRDRNRAAKGRQASWEEQRIRPLPSRRRTTRRWQTPSRR